MEKSINDLQAIINKTALDRVTARVRNLCDAMKADNDLSRLLANYSIQFSGEVNTVRGWFWSTETEITKKMINDLLPDEIERVSTEFVQKVNKLESDVDELFARNIS